MKCLIEMNSYRKRFTDLDLFFAFSFTDRRLAVLMALKETSIEEISMDGEGAVRRLETTNPITAFHTFKLLKDRRSNQEPDNVLVYAEVSSKKENVQEPAWLDK